MSETSRPTATHEIQLDDNLVRVTRWSFEPGAETGWHTHGMNYVVVPLTTCHYLIEEPGGQSREVTVQAGQSYSRESGTVHNIINNGSEPMSFVEVEMKE